MEDIYSGGRQCGQRQTWPDKPQAAEHHVVIKEVGIADAGVDTALDQGRLLG